MWSLTDSVGAREAGVAIEAAGVAMHAAGAASTACAADRAKGTAAGDQAVGVAAVATVAAVRAVAAESFSVAAVSAIPTFPTSACHRSTAATRQAESRIPSGATGPARPAIAARAGN